MSMTLKEQIAVQQAKLDDDALVIQARLHGCSKWIDCCIPLWNFYKHDYRVKPCVPRTTFQNEYRKGVRGCYYESLEEAIQQIDHGANFIGTIKWREVLDDPDRLTTFAAAVRKQRDRLEQIVADYPSGLPEYLMAVAILDAMDAMDENDRVKETER